MPYIFASILNRKYRIVPLTPPNQYISFGHFYWFYWEIDFTHLSKRAYYAKIDIGSVCAGSDAVASVGTK